ncbi:MAG TPA: SNF2 helicase-associated domain-containing protein, partial [Actinomycetes bacterium]
MPADPPRAGAFAVWGDLPGPDEIGLVLPAAGGVRRRRVHGRLLPLADVLPALLAPAAAGGASASVAAWSAAAAAGVGLVARGRLLPAASPGGYGAWRVGPLDGADLDWLRRIAAAMPPEAHALPVDGRRPLRLRSPERLVRELWDAIADVLVRSPAAVHATGARAFAAAEPVQVGELADWLAETDRGLDAGAQVQLRLELPVKEEPFAAVVQVRSVVDPSLVVDAEQLWSAPAVVLARLGERAETDLLLALRRGARAWPPLAPLLRSAAPTEVSLDEEQLAELLETGAEALGGAGIEVLWPAELLGEGLEVRATVATPAPAGAAQPVFRLEALLGFDWQVTVGGEALTAEEVAALAEAKRPLVRLRGRWVRVNRELLERLRRRRGPRIPAAEALTAALAGSLVVDGERVEFHATGALADLVDRLAGAGRAAVEPPGGLRGTLRPYQRRGVSWLARMCELGLGGCLADDMGLGKTVQVIALHLHRRPLGAGPTLVACPT